MNNIQRLGPDPTGDVDREILRAIRAIRFGSVEVVIHDSRVVHIACTQKIRVGHSHEPPGSRVAAADAPL